MGQIKINRATRLAGKLPMATREISKMIPDRLWERLTGADLAAVMDLMDKSYHNGRASTGAEVIDSNPTDGAVWVNVLNASIEWTEEGAEYERVEEIIPVGAPGNGSSSPYTKISQRKIKQGRLVAVVRPS